jgi:hypothetical protein
VQVKADPLHLPFAEKSVDACLLAHTLPWCSDPHRLLREADRVLIDDGWMILTGFNPVSLMGLRKLVPVLRKTTPYNSRMFTLMRQLDWLSLLNFEVLHYGVIRCCPGRGRAANLSTHLPALGCLQLIVARKRTIPLTLNPMKSGKAKRSCARRRHAAVAQGAELAFWLVADVVCVGLEAAARQLVAAFVFRMAGMAFNPFPFDLMLAQRGIQALPEIDIFTGFLSAVFQPRFFQLWIHWVIPWRTYWLSVLSTTSQCSFSASRATIAAIISMRLLVVR